MADKTHKTNTVRSFLQKHRMFLPFLVGTKPSEEEEGRRGGSRWGFFSHFFRTNKTCNKGEEESDSTIGFSKKLLSKNFFFSFFWDYRDKKKWGSSFWINLKNKHWNSIKCGTTMAPDIDKRQNREAASQTKRPKQINVERIMNTVGKKPEIYCGGARLLKGDKSIKWGLLWFIWFKSRKIKIGFFFFNVWRIRMVEFKTFFGFGFWEQWSVTCKD